MKEAKLPMQDHKEQLSGFIEAAAHDLHAPLRKLSIWTDRIFSKYESQFDEQTKDYFVRIEKCIGEMRVLIDGLTELARADSPNTILVPCDLNSIVANAVQMLGEEVEAKHASVQFGPLPVICGNPVLYTQLFKNLLENSLKFSFREKPPHIQITAGPATKEENAAFHFPVEKKYYKVEIRDNGIGFNQVYAEKIFEPFVRLHAKSMYEGSGLGLSICKKVVANHNGIIYAQGTEEEGSLFILILPETP